MTDAPEDDDRMWQEIHCEADFREFCLTWKGTYQELLEFSVLLYWQLVDVKFRLDKYEPEEDE